MRNIFFFLLIISSSLFTQNYEIIEDKCALKILSPSLKNRETAKLRLNNGLTVYIVSDPEIKESAAAMAINAGSWNDPEKYPGMAHLIEHMLFQGTSLYPDRNDFFRYMSDLGGNFNAYTEPDKTVYFFSVNNSSFPDGLKRFSQFFISPLFDPSAIQSELVAVDQEHSKNIENDMRRFAQVWKETSNDAHPNHRFATGNSATLSKIPRESMLEWHSEHYKANEMRLAIYSPDPLEHSIMVIAKLFQDIPSGESKKKVNLPELSSSLQKGHIIYIKPIKDIQQMILQWELPQELVDDETKSASLVAYAINAGDKSSLFNNLKKENLVDELIASVSTVGKYSAFLNIEITLTDEGTANGNKVIQKCFEKIESLKKQNIPYYLFQERKIMSELNYQYQNRSDPYDHIDDIAADLLVEDITTYPEKTVVASTFSSERIQKALNSLSPAACQVYFLAPQNKSSILPNKKEKWVEVEYAVEEFSSDLVKSLSDIKNNLNFELPPPNSFIPSNLSIYPDEEEAAPYAKIADNEYGIGYFIPNPFHTPEIHWTFKIKTPSFDFSPRSYVLLDLFSKTLLDNLSDLFTQANRAGIYPNIDIGQEEIILQIHGYYEKAPLLLEQILKTFKSPLLTKEQFSNYKKLFQQTYGNCKFNLPVNQASEELSCLLNKNLSSNEDKLKILETITYEEGKKFLSTLFDETYLKCIFTGNRSIKESESLWLNVQAILSGSPHKNIEDQIKILSLQEGPYKILKKTDAMGSGIILAIDENPFSFTRMASQDILSQSIKEPFFSEMRSKQNMAYFARSWNLEAKQHLFQLFAVQSATIPCRELLYRFEIFIENYLANIETNVDKERFNKIKENLIFQLRIPPQNVDELAQKFNRLAFTHKDFDFEEKKIEALSKLSYEEFLALSKEFLSRYNKKRLALLVEGKLDKKNNIDYKTISSKEILASFEYTSAFSSEE